MYLHSAHSYAYTRVRAYTDPNMHLTLIGLSVYKYKFPLFNSGFEIPSRCSGLLAIRVCIAGLVGLKDLDTWEKRRSFFAVAVCNSNLLGQSILIWTYVSTYVHKMPVEATTYEYDWLACIIANIYMVGYL